MLRSLAPQARRASRKMLRAESGTISVEFALISPMLLVVLVAGTEVTQSVMASRKVASATRTMADLTAQTPKNTTLTTAAIDDIVAAGRLIMSPYPGASMRVTLSRVDVTSVGGVLQARTVWSTVRNGGSKRPCTVLNRISNAAEPSLTGFPEGMYYAGRFIIADVTYIFSAPLTTNFSPTSLGFSGWTSTANGIEIKRTVYMQARIDSNPTMTGADACAA
jgi:Flp pilus assembly protein TadG